MYLSQDANELEHRGSSPDSSHSLKVSSLVPGSKSLVSEETILITFLFFIFVYFFYLCSPWSLGARVSCQNRLYLLFFYFLSLYIIFIFNPCSPGSKSLVSEET